MPTNRIRKSRSRTGGLAQDMHRDYFCITGFFLDCCGDAQFETDEELQRRYWQTHRERIIANWMQGRSEESAKGGCEFMRKFDAKETNDDDKTLG